MLDLAALESDHLTAYAEHVVRHLAESGQDGQPTFTTYGRAHRLDLAAWHAQRTHQILLPIDEPHWRRGWLLRDGDRVVGHIELNGPGIDTATHRCTLGMGLEAPYRRQGWGTKLVERALTWVRANKRLGWVDLDVFAHNEPALALYRKLGFEEVGRRVDYLRVDGQSIDGVLMTKMM